MNNKLKTLIGSILLFTASFASAKCVIDADYIMAASKGDKLPNIGCEILTDRKHFSVMDLTDMGMNAITIQIYNQPNLEEIDLRGLPEKKHYTVDVGGSPNVDKINIGKLQLFLPFNTRGTKITDLRFLENIKEANLQPAKISNLPPNNSIFCQSAREGKIQMDNRKNRVLLENACKLEEEPK